MCTHLGEPGTGTRDLALQTVHAPVEPRYAGGELVLERLYLLLRRANSLLYMRE